MLRDGTVLQTKVSHNNDQYGADLWARIWRFQLGLESAAQFWRVIRTRTAIQRPGDLPPTAVPAAPGLPLALVMNLQYVVGMPSDLVLRMSLVDARSRWEEFLKTGEKYQG